MKLSLEAIRKLISQRLRGADVQEFDPNSWMVPYGNLMTILMIFFLILYAFTNLNKSVYEKAVMDIDMELASPEEREKKMTELEKIAKFENFVWNSALEKFVEIELQSRKIVIRLKEPILFDKGDSKLKDIAGAALAEIAEFIKSVEGRVSVEGYTDDLPVRSGRFESNWQLAASRAYSIVEHFVNNENLQPSRFAIMSYAHNRPVAPNDTEENRAKNRRIEINITKS